MMVILMLLMNFLMLCDDDDPSFDLLSFYQARRQDSIDDYEKILHGREATHRRRRQADSKPRESDDWRIQRLGPNDSKRVR
jgi:hypothetical protein